MVSPVRDAGVKHVEFVALGADQALAIMVFEDGLVENRLMRRPAGITPVALQDASNFLNARLRGKTLRRGEARRRRRTGARPQGAGRGGREVD